MYVSKDVRIRGYFSKKKGPASKKVWETLYQRILVLRPEVQKSK
jgi:hypothetical protein